MIAVILVIFIVIIIFIIVADSRTGGKKPGDKNPLQPPKIITDFKVYNYLPNHSISIDVLPQNPDRITTGKPKQLIEEIGSKKYAGLYLDQVLNDLKPGNVLRIYIFSPHKRQNKTEYADYVMSTEKDERIKALHVGMVTTRFIGDAHAFFGEVARQPMGSSSSSWVNVHNLTNIPLSLNEGRIKVPPHGVTRVKGIHGRNNGVPLGMWFRDDDGIYPTYQHLQPYSDLYYGVVSDIQQAVNSFIWEPSADVINWGESPAQTLWPFQAGIY